MRKKIKLKSQFVFEQYWFFMPYEIEDPVIIAVKATDSRDLVTITFFYAQNMISGEP